MINVGCDINEKTDFELFKKFVIKIFFGIIYFVCLYLNNFIM